MKPTHNPLTSERRISPSELRRAHARPRPLPAARTPQRSFGALLPHTRRALQRRAVIIAALLMGSALLSRPASAGDEALYGPVAPPGSAFIRVFNATAQGGLEARVADQTITDIEPFAASEFVFLPAGRHTIAIGAAKQTVGMVSDRFYTAALTDGTIQMLDNERFKNRLKSLIVLYNLTAQSPLSLRTADGKTVVDNVASKTSGTREVNAVNASLALYNGSQKLADVKPIGMERGRAYSLFVIGSDAQPMTVWVVN